LIDRVSLMDLIYLLRFAMTADDVRWIIIRVRSVET